MTNPVRPDWALMDRAWLRYVAGLSNEGRGAAALGLLTVERCALFAASRYAGKPALRARMAPGLERAVEQLRRWREGLHSVPALTDRKALRDLPAALVPWAAFYAPATCRGTWEGRELAELLRGAVDHVHGARW